jgi:hypothetical protein
LIYLLTLPLFGGTFSYIGQGVHAFGAFSETGVVANSNNRTGYF